MARYDWATSSAKHGVARERALHVLETAPVAFPVADEDGDPDPSLLLFLGDDPNGVPLEILVRLLEDDVVRVFHVMPAREVPVPLRADAQVMTMTKKQWTPEREAAALAKAETGLAPGEIGAAVPNPLRKAGRPSLSPEGGTSKALNARIPSDLHGKVVAYAVRTGRSVSDLTRDALSALLSADDEAQLAPPRAVTKRAPRAAKATGTPRGAASVQPDDTKSPRKAKPAKPAGASPRRGL